MAAKRKGLSKKTRFEVFKRDAFQCAYCGATPPAVVLHVDHILAVAEGGTNVMGNLVTSCVACNQGKGARDLSVAPAPLALKRAELAEREEQLREYQVLLAERHARLEDEAWEVASELVGEPLEHYNRDRLASIRRFIEQSGFYSVRDSAERARLRVRSDHARFKYFCGICWKKIKEPANACA